MKKVALLNPFIEASRHRPFEWGTWDCCQFASEWVSQATGVDHRLAIPQYTNEAEARDVLERAGGLVRLVSLFVNSIHKSQAMRGDLVLANDPCGAALGICLGVHSAHVGANGLIFFPTAAAIHAWRVV